MARNFDLVPIVFEKIQLDQSPVATRKRSVEASGRLTRCFLGTWVVYLDLFNGDFYFLQWYIHHFETTIWENIIIFSRHLMQIQVYAVYTG